MPAALSMSQSKRRVLFRNLMFALLGAIAVLAIASRMFDLHLHWFSSALLLTGLAVAVLQFQSLDEVAKQAHYVAWLWGSMAVMGAIGVAVAVLRVLHRRFDLPIEGLLTSVYGDAEPSTAFMAGLMTAPSLMVIGYSVWWAAYWLRRR